MLQRDSSLDRLLNEIAAAIETAAPGEFVLVARRDASGAWHVTTTSRVPGADIGLVDGAVTLDERTVGGVTVLTPAGRLAFQEGDDGFRRVSQRLVDRGRVRVVLDLARVTYVDSVALGQLVSMHTSLSRRGGALKLVRVPPRVRDLLVVTKLTALFELFDTERDAVASFGAEVAGDS